MTNAPVVALRRRQALRPRWSLTPYQLMAHHDQRLSEQGLTYSSPDNFGVDSIATAPGTVIWAHRGLLASFFTPAISAAPLITSNAARR